MSKSELSDLSRINLTDNKDEIINKIKKAKTDPLPMPQHIKELDQRLEAKNLLGIYSSLTNSKLENSVKNFAGKNFSEFKEKAGKDKEKASVGLYIYPILMASDILLYDAPIISTNKKYLKELKKHLKKNE